MYYPKVLRHLHIIRRGKYNIVNVCPFMCVHVCVSCVYVCTSQFVPFTATVLTPEVLSSVLAAKCSSAETTREERKKC